MGLGYIYDIIISPITTEKTSLQSSENKFTFKVKDFATKIDIEKVKVKLKGLGVKSVKKVMLKKLL